jgi:2-polyprenyl-6-methoxyphenol hydroxylase-like FAD-dependent oxidoreductase
LRRLGVLEKFFCENSIRIKQVSHLFRSPLSRKTLRLEVGYEKREGIDYGLALFHEEILKGLREEYARLGGRLEEGLALSQIEPVQQGYVLTLENGRKLGASYFVGADGRHSPSRKMLGMSLCELPTRRVMMAALVEGLRVPLHEFYTEELDGGILYAFQYPRDQVRIYICFDAARIKEAATDRKGFFRQLFDQSALPGVRAAHVKGPIFMMPTADQMLVRRSAGRAIWFGDAAGVVDPLGGHGMTVALEDAFRIADTLASKRPDLTAAGRISQAEFLHARFLGAWIGLLFMGQSLPLRMAKWKAFREYRNDPSLRRYLVDLFSGRNRDPLSLIDVPYLLGWVPSAVREYLHESSLNQRWIEHQGLLLTAAKPIATGTLRRLGRWAREASRPAPLL